MPALRGGRLDREAVFTHHPHCQAATLQRPSTSVRRGDWKLIRFYCDAPGRQDRFELYNLADDIGESRDLAPTQPDQVAALNLLIDDFLARTEAVVPRPNPAYQEGLDPFPNGPARVGLEPN